MIFQDISNFVTWPIVALVAIAASALGLLNSPFRALGESFGGVVRELRQLKHELPQIEASVGSLTTAVNGLPGQVDGSVTEITERLSVAFDERLAELETTLKKRINDLATPDSDLELNEVLEAEQPTVRLLGDKADSAISRIKQLWSDVVNRMLDLDPEGDRRSIGALALQISEDDPDTLSTEVAERIADLHGRFKSYTRRQQYADEWLTDQQFAAFERDVRRVLDTF